MDINPNISLVITIILAIFSIVEVASSENPRLVIAGIISFVICLIVIPLIWVKIRKIKRLFYKTISSKSVLSVQEAEEIKGRVQVLLDNKPVREAQMIGLKIWNSGTLIIKMDDYYNNSFNINFGEGVEVLEAKVANTLPKSIQPEVKIKRCHSKSCVTSSCETRLV